jgi:hypothetical protein
MGKLNHAVIAAWMAYLGHPRDNDDSGCSTFFVIPNFHRSSCTLVIRESGITGFHHFFLRDGIGCATTIMWRVHPPDNGEKYCP